MGYESRLYIIQKDKYNMPMSLIKGKKYKYAEAIASFDLRKDYDVSDRMRLYPATEYAIIGDDCDTWITCDMYGEPLREMTISDAIRILEKAEAEDHYRRRTPLLTMLKAFQPDEWDELAVLHYGY